MPINLDDLTTATAAVRSLSPKYFSKELTGSGKKTGIINERLRPNSISLTQSVSVTNNPIERKSKQVAGDTTTRYIPLAPMLQRCLLGSVQVERAIPDYDDMLQIHTDPGKPQVWLNLTPQALVLRVEAKSGGGTYREVLIQYRIEVYHVVDSADPNAFVMRPNSKVNSVSFAWSFDAAKSSLQMLTSFVPKPNAHTIGLWMDDYDVHDRICRLAQEWSSDELSHEMIQHISSMSKASVSTAQLDDLAMQLRYLETYGVSLRAYRDIHDCIKSSFSPDITAELCKHNLNLLMNSTLENLEGMKAQLSAPPKAAPGSQAAMQSRFSTQQKQAVTTNEPLVLVQAGAGTGKSTVILGRIDHLVSCGVTPSDITVLSFTNAAADNISAKNPSIGSMTIARMIHDIYNENYTGHELSSIDTIINSLDIFYPQDDMAARFRRHLLLVAKNEQGAFTGMNTFIERNFDAVMAMLDTIRQTSLELEIIICYQKIEQMKEPAHVMSKYLVIDEVQDNSIFEFIFVLKYVAKHQENLYIVGDCSQTLYEFRSSNPKALNALESSGVFATFKLTTNYRSNQEILDFANVTLADIEANQFAGIQLQANNLVLPTARSFQEKVTLDYRCYPKVTEFPKDLGGIITHTVAEYIEECFKRDEQVAFLAYSRREVSIIKEAVERHWPNRTLANLVPEKVFPSTIFSQFIKSYWDLVLQVAPKDASFVISQEIINNLDRLTRNSAKAEPQVRAMISEWWLESNGTINAWVQLYNISQLSKDAFFSQLRESLLDYEIRHNGIKQSMTSQRNKAAKERNLGVKTDFVVSTIHSAKGLEFENVVVIHRYESQMDEADKRMFYVAFTRAMNTEYVLSYGTLKNPKIESDYELMVKALEERDAANALRSMTGSNGSDDDEDEIISVAGDADPEPDAKYEADLDDEDLVMSGVSCGSGSNQDD